VTQVTGPEFKPQYCKKIDNITGLSQKLFIKVEEMLVRLALLLFETQYVSFLFFSTKKKEIMVINC
jgi:hypothetical protein